VEVSNRKTGQFSYEVFQGFDHRTVDLAPAGVILSELRAVGPAERLA